MKKLVLFIIFLALIMGLSFFCTTVNAASTFKTEQIASYDPELILAPFDHWGTYALITGLFAVSFLAIFLLWNDASRGDGFGAEVLYVVMVCAMGISIILSWLVFKSWLVFICLWAAISFGFVLGRLIRYWIDLIREPKMQE